MRIATTKGEKKVAELVKRLFEIEGTRARATGKLADEELIRLNPYLKDLQALPAGTPFLVPDLPGARTGEEARAVTLGVAVVIEGQHKAMGVLRKRLSDSAEQEMEEVKAEIELAKSKNLHTLAARHPDLRQRLSMIAEAAQARLQEIEEANAVRERHLEELEKDFGDLLKRLS